MSDSKNEVAVAKENPLVTANIKEIAKLCKRDVDITKSLSDHTIDNMKAFLVAYSRSQLTRVIKLTDALGKLEDALIEQSIKPENLDPYMLMNVIRVIQNSLNQALSMIQKVTSDESYINVVINNTKNINNTINQCNIHNSVPVLLSQDSRDKVRNMTSQIIEQLSQIEKKEGIVVEDAKVTEVTEDKVEEGE